MLLQSHGAGAAGSSQSGAGKIFPAQYKECTLDIHLIECFLLSWVIYLVCIPHLTSHIDLGVHCRPEHMDILFLQAVSCLENIAIVHMV